MFREIKIMVDGENRVKMKKGEKWKMKRFTALRHKSSTSINKNRRSVHFSYILASMQTAFFVWGNDNANFFVANAEWRNILNEDINRKIVIEWPWGSI